MLEPVMGRVDIPATFTNVDVLQVEHAANIVRRGHGAMRISELSMDIPADEVDGITQEVQRGHLGRHPVRFPIFGREALLGLAEFANPPVTVFRTEAGSTPGVVRLVLQIDDAHVPFSLVEADPEPATLSPWLWTPGRGPSGLLD